MPPLVQPSPVIRMQFFDANGDPLALGWVYTFAAGTNTPLATYTDHTGTSQNTNPIHLDSGGYADIWLTADSYKIRVEDANHVALYTIDGLPGIGSLITVGDLPPLFTSSLAAGALNFAFQSAGAGTLFGRFAGTPGDPSYGVIGSDGQITYNNGGQMAGAVQVTYDDTPAAEFLRVVNRIKFNTGAAAEIQDNVNKFFITCQFGGQINLGVLGDEPERFVMGPTGGEFRFGVAGYEAVLKLNDGLNAAGIFQGPVIQVGQNTPEGAVTARVGSLFLRTDGGAVTTLYVKESGTGNVGWVAK